MCFLLQIEKKSHRSKDSLTLLTDVLNTLKPSAFRDTMLMCYKVDLLPVQFSLDALHVIFSKEKSSFLLRYNTYHLPTWRNKYQYSVHHNPSPRRHVGVG